MIYRVYGRMDSSPDLERQIVVVTHTMTGNTGIQLAVAHILAEYIGISRLVTHDSTKEYSDSSRDYTSITEDSWSQIHPFLGPELQTRLPPRFTSINTSIYLTGYFQDSVPLVKHRELILDKFRENNTVISQSGHTIQEFLAQPSPISLSPEDIVLHVRLGDMPCIDPVPQLAILRRLQPRRLIIVAVKPKTDIEKSYLKLFEEFRPVFQHGTELEDFAVLREAHRIMVTNSTFSWLASFVGKARQRWIPVPTYNTLGKIDESDILYKAANGFNITSLDIPTEPFLPVTGEFLQSMCDYSILNQKKKEELHITIDYAHPPEKQLFIEDIWPTEVFNAKSLFIYPTEHSSTARHVFGHSWPNLKLIMFHNSDYELDYTSVIPFLEANPGVYCWAQNSTKWHPRIRPIPIGEENRMWRGGSLDYEPTVFISRNEERDIGILAPYWSITHPIRLVWSKEIQGLGKLVHQLPHQGKSDYLERVSECRALICPPGNGVDTHRHWDALAMGAWAIVKDSVHTQLLLNTYPSLHLLPVYDMNDLEDLVIPDEIPPFHPLLLRQFWRILFASYIQ